MEGQSLLAQEVSVSVPRAIADDIESLIVANAMVPLNLRQQFLEMCDEVNPGVRWSGNPHLAERWINGLERAEKLAHKGSGLADEEQAERLFAELERLVLVIFRPAPERERSARALAESATPDTVLDALATLVTISDHTTFYENLHRSDVLDRLASKGIFQIEEGEAEPPFWPEATYLAYVAAEEPAAVAKILASVRATVPAVVRQLLAAAMRLPDAHLARVAERARWLRRAQAVTLYAGYGNVMERLGQAGYLDVAFMLATSLLRLTSEPDPMSRLFQDRTRDRAVPIVGADAFEDALSRVVETLGLVDPMRTMVLFSDTLDRALVIEGMDEYDTSSVWMPDVLDRTVASYSVLGQAAGALADIAIAAAEQRSDEVLAFLAGRGAGGIYERIALAVIVRWGLTVEAAQSLLDEQLWLRRGPEHLALVETFYPKLSADQRDAIFAAARSAIEPWYRSWLVDPENPRADDEDRVLGNLANAFGRAIDAVPTPQLSRLRAAVDAIQPPTPVVPPDEKVLAEMSPPDIVAELRRWEASAPGQEWWGLGQTVWRLVERETAQWLADGLISALSDRYLAWALHGLRNQRNASKPQHDAAVLAVVEDAVRRAEVLAARGGEADRSEARALAQPAGITLADLARDVTDAQTLDRILAAARILGGIAQTAIDERQGVPAQAISAVLGDPHALAVTIAGEALKAAARRGLPKTVTLDLYDAFTHDATLTVRAALGGEFTFFAGWDDQRAGAWAARIFLSGNERADEAAWAGYVLHSQLTRVTYLLLRSAYVRRLVEMGASEPPDSSALLAGQSGDSHQVDEATLTHVWILAWNQEESVETDGSLMQLVLDRARPELIGALLRIVARDLARPGTDPSVGKKIAAEAMRLWEFVRVGAHDGRYPASILASFGLWARSSILPAAWRLAQVEALLKVPDIGLARERDLVQGVVELADEDMPRALRVLRVLARRRNVPAMTAVSQYAGPLLRAAHNAGEESALLAIDINSIMRDCFYRDLLDGAAG